MNAKNFVCEDIDECRELGPEACFNGECVNTHGSYKCECDPGSILDNTGRICIGINFNNLFQNCFKLFIFLLQIIEKDLVGQRLIEVAVRTIYPS